MTTLFSSTSTPSSITSELAVADRHRAGVIGADQVAFDPVAAEATQYDTGADIARDDIAGAGRIAADGVLITVRPNAGKDAFIPTIAQSFCSCTRRCQ